MKIFLIGSDAPWDFATSCRRVFEELGTGVVHWSNKKKSPLLLGRDWWAMSRLERRVYDAIRSAELVRDLRAARPDLVFLIKGENIHSAALRRGLEATGARLAIWYVDNPFCASVTSYEVLKNLELADVFYSYGRFLFDALTSAGCRRVKYLPFAYDGHLHPGGLSLTPEDRAKYGAGVCFVGTWDAGRERHLERLAAFDLAIYGRGWDRRIAPKSPLAGAVRDGLVWGEEMSKCFTGSRVVLNLLRAFNHDAHNFRTMEATGIGGGVLLTKRTPQQCAELFEEGRHLFAYEREEDMGEALAEVLARDDEELKRVAAAARRRVEERHLLRHRLGEVLEDFS